MTDIDRDLHKTSAGFYALAALRVFDRAFDDKTPYKVVSSVIAGKPPFPPDITWIDEKIETLANSIELMKLTKGDIVGAYHALLAVKLCLHDWVDPQQVYNESARAERAVSGLG